MNEDARSGGRAPLRGMILAAGYGTRLAPVTDHVPKPLLPIDGQPLLDRIIESFDRVGIRNIGVNTHHLGAMVTDHVVRRSDADRFILFPEEKILGTGGALHGARDFLGDVPCFLLHNGDVLCDADLSGLVDEHQRSGALATLLLVDWPAVNSVVLDEDGRIVSIAGRPWPVSGGRNLTYTGIGIFSRGLLDDIGPGFSSLIDPLVRAMESDPDSVRGMAPGDFRWSDLGTLTRYLEAQSEVPPSPPEKEQAQGLSLERITGHGSDRKFWRLGVGDWTAVAMTSPPQDEEFGRFISIAGWLGGLDLGSPAVLSVSDQDHTVLMEDLGGESLYSLVRREGFGSARVADAYRRTVDRLVGIQAATPEAMTECHAAVDRSLDYDALRWETAYFKDHFLVGDLDMDPADLGQLEPEFHALAALVAAQPQVLIHRDFQSQNIIVAGERIRLVDFQGMRLGPLAYDLASLAFDPYVSLPAALSSELVERFATRGEFQATVQEIQAMVLAAGLQRVMQALGAYGFLGHVKGKREFLAFIPAGRVVLRELLGKLGENAGRPPGPGGNWLPASMPKLARLLGSGDGEA